MYSEKGQSLMELVVVIAVMVIVIGALTFATIASLRNAQFSKNQAQATKLAQEGLEWARTGRDRNSTIGGSLGDVSSWNGDGTSESSIWSYTIFSNCEIVFPGNKCYFKIFSDGSLQYINSSPAFPSDFAETPVSAPMFKRAVILSDDNSSACAKKVTSIVQWKDFSGDHSSTLTTILRNVSCK